MSTIQGKVHGLVAREFVAKVGEIPTTLALEAAEVLVLPGPLGVSLLVSVYSSWSPVTWVFDL